MLNIGVCIEQFHHLNLPNHMPHHDFCLGNTPGRYDLRFVPRRHTRRPQLGRYTHPCMSKFNRPAPILRRLSLPVLDLGGTFQQGWLVLTSRIKSRAFPHSMFHVESVHSASLVSMELIGSYAASTNASLDFSCCSFSSDRLVLSWAGALGPKCGLQETVWLCTEFHQQVWCLSGLADCPMV